MRSSYSIIIADDDTITCSLMQTIVKRIYPTALVFLAYNGAEALHLHTRHGADLLIIDYSMPVMNGLDLVRALRSRQVTAPIVMISGHLSVEQQCLDAGATLFCSKPVDINRFIAELTRLLSP